MPKQRKTHDLRVPRGAGSPTTARGGEGERNKAIDANDKTERGFDFDNNQKRFPGGIHGNM